MIPAELSASIRQATNMPIGIMEWTASHGCRTADRRLRTYVPYVLTDALRSITRQNGHWPPALRNPTRELYNEDDESPITMFAGVC